MEGGQRTGDLERLGRLLATHRTSLRNHPFVEVAPDRLDQQTEGDDISVLRTQS